MNSLPISLVLITSLLITVVWHPSSSTPVKEGHHKVVVEFDKADGSTRVLISPQAVVVPSEVASKETPEGTTSYGKCKNKIANAFGKTKDTVTKTPHAVSNKAQEMEEHAKEAVNEAIEKPPQHPGEAKDTISERVAEKVPGHTLGEFLVKAKDIVTTGSVGEAKKVTRNAIAIVKEFKSKQFDIIDSPKRIGEDISRNVSGQVKKTADQVKETVKNVQQVLGQRSLNDILYKLREVAYHTLFLDKIGSVAGLVHMLGFSTAYGMCVWVTFVSSYILGRCLSRQVFGMVQSRIYPVYFRGMAYCVSAALFGHVASDKSEILASRVGMFQSLSLLSALLMVLTNMILLEPRATKVMCKRMKLEKEEGRRVGVAVEAKDGMVDGSRATVVRSSSSSGKGIRVAAPAKDGMVDGRDGGTMVRPAANGEGVRAAVPAKEGMINGGDGSRVARSVAVERRDLLRLNEKLKRLNAYSSALNLFTLVTLTWHMAYMGQWLQAIHGK